MKALFRFAAMSATSALGWWLGSFVGLMTAVVLSALFSGLGLWGAHWISRNWME
ncbi:MAG: hypothetical protein HY823_11740 [Acidobacteria bacterium]|nr:hypothetical protein [Acidobacteriota bacterium]